MAGGAGRAPAASPSASRSRAPELPPSIARRARGPLPNQPNSPVPPHSAASAMPTNPEVAPREAEVPPRPPAAGSAFSLSGRERWAGPARTRPQHRRLDGPVLGRRPAGWRGWRPTTPRWTPACAPGLRSAMSFRPEYQQTNQCAQISRQDWGAGIGIACLQRF